MQIGKFSMRIRKLCMISVKSKNKCKNLTWCNKNKNFQCKKLAWCNKNILIEKYDIELENFQCELENFHEKLH